MNKHHYFKGALILLVALALSTGCGRITRHHSSLPGDDDLPDGGVVTMLSNMLVEQATGITYSVVTSNVLVGMPWASWDKGYSGHVEGGTMLLDPGQDQWALQYLTFEIPLNTSALISRVTFLNGNNDISEDNKITSANIWTVSGNALTVAFSGSPVIGGNTQAIFGDILASKLRIRLNDSNRRGKLTFVSVESAVMKVQAQTISAANASLLTTRTVEIGTGGVTITSTGVSIKSRHQVRLLPGFSALSGSAVTIKADSTIGG